ncbi:unnamed protein product [Chondrus crispus]|uniref:Uncharacterized protein n=1 Tax=Chondrus crispus TaxID=2769 RepID=R7QTM5_CHOCR|nr:unnamed protein product [Chondrus crispus]CDF40861.1 unnamed protein product [Chondrus crispus]|eukprot:XP_005711155.1 unnamed protein product [Chondrus crispus]
MQRKASPAHTPLLAPSRVFISESQPWSPRPHPKALPPPSSTRANSLPATFRLHTLYSRLSLGHLVPYIPDWHGSIHLSPPAVFLPAP